MKKIAVSDPRFERIIKENYLYVDKTNYLYSLITSPETYYFLSRPRRFGKSLTLQTLRAIFDGKKDLFKDLYIGKETDYDFAPHSVLYFDFSKIQHKSANELELAIQEKLHQMAKDNSITLSSTLFISQFEELLSTLNAKNGSVVILIDEYDAPISDNFKKDYKEQEEIKAVLKSFYSSLKANSDYLRFVFITGVSKYAKVGVFSGMNNLINISTNKYFATMLGFTEAEILSNYSDYIDQGVKDLDISREEYLKKLKEQYDGNRFSLDSNNIETVYNPVSIGLFFTSGYGTDFKNFWMETGGTELLIKMARDIDFSILTKSEMVIDYDRVSENDIGTLINNPTEESLLYLMLQTGYLTLKEKDDNGRYILTYPNNEVKLCFSNRIINEYISSHHLEDNLNTYIMNALRQGDTKEAFEEIITLYASFSHKRFDKRSREKDFMMPLVATINSCINISNGEYAIDEESVSSGDIDYVISLKKYIYIIEAKLNKSSKDALDCILERGYYKKYLSPADNRKLILIGINFNYSIDNQSTKRLLDEPKVMEIDKDIQ